MTMDPANRDANRDSMMSSHPHPFRVYWPATLFTCALSVVAFLFIPAVILVRVIPALGPETVGNAIAQVVPPPPGETIEAVIGILVFLLVVWAMFVWAALVYMRILLTQYAWYAEHGRPIGQLTAFVLGTVARLEKTHPDEFSST